MYICRPVEQFSDLTENTIQQGGFRNFGFHERRVAPCAARVNKRKSEFWQEEIYFRRAARLPPPPKKQARPNR